MFCRSSCVVVGRLVGFHGESRPRHPKRLRMHPLQAEECCDCDAPFADVSQHKVIQTSCLSQSYRATKRISLDYKVTSRKLCSELHSSGMIDTRISTACGQKHNKQRQGEAKQDCSVAFFMRANKDLVCGRLSWLKPLRRRPLVP